MALLNQGTGSQFAVRGNYHIPVIPIAFRDVAPPFPPDQYQQLLFGATPAGGRPWSVKTYYGAASRGNITLDGTVFPWVHVDSNSTYYEDGCNGIGVLSACPARTVSPMRKLLIDALDSISLAPNGETVWDAFDNDGPDGLPNSGDDDGVVDVVAYLQPKVDGACGTDAIWAHRYRISGWTSGQPYQTRTPRRGPGGVPISGQFLTVDSYTIQSALGGNTACTNGEIMPIGTIAHETGHAFGLPDLYDTDVFSGTQGIGEWGLMSSGSYARPYSPASFEAWSLAVLGWARVDTLAPGTMTTAPPVQTGNVIYFGATAVAGTYLLIENRQRLGTDTAMMNPAFSRAKAPGLLIWLVDQPRIDAGAPGNRVNTGTRQGLALMQADGKNQLRSSGFGLANRGDPGDPYPGSSDNHDFGLATNPSAIGWDQTPLGVRVDQIQVLADGSVRFRYLRRAPVLVASRVPQGRVRVNGTLTSAYREVIAPGDQLDLSADSSQTSFDTRSVFQFLAWSDGGTRTHTVFGRPGPPDTLWADFTSKHRLRVQVSGPGSVASSVAGSMASGVFLDGGSVVHLTATSANSSAAFLGWKGDSATATPSLDLILSRPWDLTAAFAQSANVNVNAAAAALLGGPPLDAAANSYLDAIGNGNGVYDVGDYLALLHRSGNQGPAITQQLPAVIRSPR